MALKSKLYLAFIFMIILSVFTAVISIRAFRDASANIDATRGQVGYVVKDLIPASDCWLNISTQIVSAGLNYYAYALNFDAKNHDNANAEIAALERQFSQLDGILRSAGQDRLTGSRNAIGECRKGVDELKNLGQRVRETDNKLKELNASFISTQDEITAIAEDEYNNAYGRLKELLVVPAAVTVAPSADENDEAAEDIPDAATTEQPTDERQTAIDAATGRLEFISDLFDFVAWSNQAFWRAQSLRGAEAKKYYDDSQEHLAGLVARIEEYNTTENVPESRQRALFNQTKDISRRLIAVSMEIEQSYLNLATLTEELGKVANATSAKARDAAGDTSSQVLDNGNAIFTETNAIDHTVGRAEWMQYLVLAGTVLIGLLLAWFITRTIVNPIDRAIARLDAGAQVIASAADHIASASQSLAEGANEQTSSMEETTGALEEIASMSKMSANNAGMANTQTRDTVHLIQEGTSSMEEMAAAMAEINERSERVSHIIKTIEDIAFQTNLLALNAAVEAARAGEAGKGFAVVADEVRNLSQRSATAARDTTTLIQETVDSIHRGSQITDRLESSYKDIRKGTAGISDLVDQIAQAANEQAQGVEQVNHSLARMDKITQDNHANSRETATASTDLTGQMGMLHNTISELSQLVHGGAQPRQQPKRERTRYIQSSPKPPAPRPALQQPRPISPKHVPALPSTQTVMRPDDIIPLEGDFEDF